MNQLTIFCLVLGLISWYYFNKFQESEKEYGKLYKRFEQIYIENQKVKNRIKDLQSYKNDVSKTFKILDNELVLINDHLKKQNETPRQQRQTRPSIFGSLASMTTLPMMNPLVQQGTLNAERTERFGQGTLNAERTERFGQGTLPNIRVPIIPNNNISLLTPELLTSLFNMNTEVPEPVLEEPVLEEPKKEESIIQEEVYEDEKFNKEIDKQLKQQLERVNTLVDLRGNYDKYLINDIDE